MKSKHWSFLLLTAITLSLFIFAGTMYALDPVLNYGSEKGITPYYTYSTLYTNPGIARHYKYDAVMVGTSMIQNTNVDLCDELFSCNMVRLPYSGGTSFDMKTILDLCFESGNDIKTVYWELDQFQLTSSAGTHRYPVPEYLYNDIWWDDLSYLLNMDIFYHYGINNILGSLQGLASPAERRGITLTGNFGEAYTLASYNRPKQSSNVVKFEESTQKTNVDANLANILSVVNAHPDTEFVFFMPPFSVLYWDREIRNGTFDSTMDLTLYAIKQLVSNKNVTLYYYQAEESIISNLDNYKDYSHYGNWINDLITTYIAAGKNKVTLENCDAVIYEMKDHLHSYNFDAIFSK